MSLDQLLAQVPDDYVWVLRKQPDGMFLAHLYYKDAEAQAWMGIGTHHPDHKSVKVFARSIDDALGRALIQLGLPLQEAIADV